jgi:tRNA pseudouridine-54 N-methylase
MTQPTGLLRFIQILPQSSTDGKFLLRDLPGSGKRIDILCRGLAACFDWGPSTWPKTQLELTAVIGNEIILTFHHSGEDYVKGEPQWGSIIRDAMTGNLSDSVIVKHSSLHDFIAELLESAGSRLWVLEEDGMPISSCIGKDQATQSSFIVGDHRGFDSGTQRVIDNCNIPSVSLGAASYLSSHCVAAVISEFERMIE